ncbi:MAG: DUF4258 domain-containing protein, partial [Candidatus Omnitrophica bacterium]|nr:DUF4258 domain-containing protein [Candidatus Omnitrophota bacterium]
IYTKHINIRIEQRDLSRSQIQNAIIAPENKIPSFKGRMVVQKCFNNKILEVVYKKTNGTTIIITAYWLDKEI